MVRAVLFLILGMLAVLLIGRPAPPCTFKALPVVDWGRAYRQQQVVLIDASLVAQLL